MDTRVKPAYDASCELSDEPEVYIVAPVGYFVLRSFDLLTALTAHFNPGRPVSIRRHAQIRAW
jgi:hypothetical protein